MNGNCIDPGTIQAFLDGELATSAAARVSSHVAGCDACTVLLATAEEESSLVFSVLEREMDSLVPTQRLWAKINDSITVEKRNTPLWRKAWLIFVAQLGNPSMAMAAGLLIVVGLIAAIWVDRDPVSSPTGPDVASGVPRAASPAVPPISNVPPDVQFLSRGDDPTAAVRASNRSEKRVETGGRDVRRPAAVPAAYMPGEESYVKTIASLSQNVNSANDDVMRPSERVAYERDLAVVNDAISRLRKEVRKNPRNESAKQVLYTSYQNKIDLLNSVSQKEELMASLK